MALCLTIVDTPTLRRFSHLSHLARLTLEELLMSKIYVSSTYADLRDHRAATIGQLRRMRHDVIAMEDYIARDESAAVACTSDVAASDLYVGLVAWRYGHVPKDDNPNSLSVTEQEYRAAIDNDVPRLVFLLDETSSWPPLFFDAYTGAGDGGKQIRDFRKRLEEERLASMFTSPKDLAAKVAASVHLASAISTASDASFDFAEVVGADMMDRPTMLFNESYTPYLIEQIAKLGSTPLLKIDLRDGAYWWSTRLYALATLVHEYTAVEWLLFLEEGKTYVGLVRPAELRRALAVVQPQLDETYFQSYVPPHHPGVSPANRAGQVLAELTRRFEALPGGEESLRFLVNAEWIATQVPGLIAPAVKRAGPFDPLATYQLLQFDVPFVPVTKGSELLKVINRVGVATELARAVVERRLGRE
jgi:hypothetical protein